MKRILTFSLLICLLLCGCAKDEAPATTAAPTTAPTEVTTAPTEETTVPTEPTVLYRHPLTGAPLDAPFTDRAVAFSIGNTIAALPQHGISQADVFCEVEAEGDITRFLAIISDLSQVKTIGPIRSARTFFNSLALAYNSPIAHCGGSPRGITGYHDLTGSKIANWEHFDQFTYGTKYFYRDQDRRNNGYAQEHTLFTTGENMLKALDDQKYQKNEAWDLGFQFAEDPAISGEKATKITVTFRGKKTSDFAYDAETGLYSIRQYDRDLIDGTTGEQLAFKNLLVLYAEQTKRKGGSYMRSYYDILGEGNGYFAVDGEIIRIKWSRKEATDPFTFTLVDGTPINLGVGKTYLAVSATTSSPISYE